MLVQISSIYLIYENETVPIYADISEKKYKKIVEAKLKNIVSLLKKQKTAEQMETAGGTTRPNL